MTAVDKSFSGVIGNTALYVSDSSIRIDYHVKNPDTGSSRKRMTGVEINIRLHPKGQKAIAALMADVYSIVDHHPDATFNIDDARVSEYLTAVALVGIGRILHSENGAIRRDMGRYSRRHSGRLWLVGDDADPEVYFTPPGVVSNPQRFYHITPELEKGKTGDFTLTKMTGCDEHVVGQYVIKNYQFVKGASKMSDPIFEGVYAPTIGAIADNSERVVTSLRLVVHGSHFTIETISRISNHEARVIITSAGWAKVKDTVRDMAAAYKRAESHRGEYPNERGMCTLHLMWYLLNTFMSDKTIGGCRRSFVRELACYAKHSDVVSLPTMNAKVPNTFAIAGRSEDDVRGGAFIPTFYMDRIVNWKPADYAATPVEANPIPEETAPVSTQPKELSPVICATVPVTIITGPGGNTVRPVRILSLMISEDRVSLQIVPENEHDALSASVDLYPARGKTQIEPVLDLVAFREGIADAQKWASVDYTSGGVVINRLAEATLRHVLTGIATQGGGISKAKASSGESTHTMNRISAEDDVLTFSLVSNETGTPIVVSFEALQPIVVVQNLPHIPINEISITNHGITAGEHGGRVVNTSGALNTISTLTAVAHILAMGAFDYATEGAFDVTFFCNVMVREVFFAVVLHTLNKDNAPNFMFSDRQVIPYMDPLVTLGGIKGYIENNHSRWQRGLYTTFPTTPVHSKVSVQKSADDHLSEISKDLQAELGEPVIDIPEDDEWQVPEEAPTPTSARLRLDEDLMMGFEHTYGSIVDSIIDAFTGPDTLEARLRLIPTMEARGALVCCARALAGILDKRTALVASGDHLSKDYALMRELTIPNAVYVIESLTAVDAKLRIGQVGVYKAYAYPTELYTSSVDIQTTVIKARDILLGVS